MKICLVSDTMATMAGTEYSVVMTAIALVGRGHEVSVLAYQIHGKINPIWKQHLTESGVVLHETPDARDNKKKALQSAAEFLSDWQADIIHAIPVESLDGNFSRIALEVGSGALVGTVTSDPSPTNFWYDDLSPSRIERYDVIICAAEVLTTRFRHFCSDNVRVVVVPHILRDPNPPLESGYWVLSELQWARKRSLGAITRLREEKGPDFLVSALAMMVDVDPDITLTIYGELVEYERTKNVAQALGLDRQISWHGPFDGVADIDKVIENHCIFLLSSLFESMPISLMEVIARGRLPVASDVGAIAELFHTTGTGSLVPAGDPRAMAEATLLLLERERAPRQAALGALTFRKKYSIDKTVSRLERTYSDSLEQCQ